ncbi:MAG: zf-HC2 domain-containing protein [Nitrospirae bacterium]|nr:zf-HC2 domain-containing protein [Nitrospirota bacterium]
MDCKEIQDNLSAYIDRELPSANQETVRTHLADCGQCALQYARLRRGWQALDAWEDVTAPERMRKKILESVRPQRKPVWWRAVMSSAAVLILVFGIAVYYSGQSSLQNIANNQPSLQTAAGAFSEDEIIANLLLLQENDFFDTLDELVRIGDLPFAEEPSHGIKEPDRSSLDMVCT